MLRLLLMQTRLSSLAVSKRRLCLFRSDIYVKLVVCVSYGFSIRWNSIAGAKFVLSRMIVVG